MKMKYSYPFPVYLLMFSFVQCPPKNVVKKNAESICQKMYPSVSIYQKNDPVDWCCKCPPGSFKAADCRFGVPDSTHCSSCPFDVTNSSKQTYMEEENNSTECVISLSELYCKDFMNVHYVGGSTSARSKCECDIGFYTNTEPTDNGCNRHSPCEPGFQPIEIGTATRDTKCEKCPPGTFSNISSPVGRCKKFTICSDFEVKELAGNSENDTKCTLKFNLKTTIPSDSSQDRALLYVVTGLVVIILIVFAIICIYKWKRKKETKQIKESDEEPLSDKSSKTPSLLNSGDKAFYEDCPSLKESLKSSHIQISTV